MTTFPAHAPSPTTSEPSGFGHRRGLDDTGGGPDEGRLRQASQAAARMLHDVRDDVSRHQGWAAHLQSGAAQMAGEERLTQEALVATLHRRLEVLCARQARLEADLGRLQRPDLARASGGAAMEEFARLVATYAAGGSAPGEPEAVPMSPAPLDRAAPGEAIEDLPRSARLPPIASAEEIDRPRGRRGRPSRFMLLRVAALVAFLALLLYALGSEPSRTLEPGEDARFMASNGSSRLPQITAAPGAGAFPGIEFPMPGLPLPGALQSGAPGAAPALPSLSFPGGIDLNRLPEILPQALAAARQAF